MTGNISINWTQKAIESEIEYTLARGSERRDYGNFSLLENKFVKWSGDFNRAVMIKADSAGSLSNTISAIEELHKTKGLEDPVYMDFDETLIFKNEYSEIIENKGYYLQQEAFLISQTKDCQLPGGFRFLPMTDEETIALLKQEQIDGGYYLENEFETIDKKLHLLFTKRFRHFKLTLNDETVGSVYLAYMDDYCRLFSVVINENFRNRGYGKMLMECVKDHGKRSDRSYILLNSPARNLGFYDKCGFTSCSYINRLWKKKK